MFEEVGVLLLRPISPYLEQQLNNRFNLFRFWNFPEKTQFFKDNAHSIQAMVGNASAGADAELIDSLPKLEIISSHSVGLDQIDLEKCKEKGIKVTYTPDVLTDEVADLALSLALTVLRKIAASHRYVQNGFWKNGDYMLGTKFSGKTVGIIGLDHLQQMRQMKKN